jgi:peptide/nickel transport system substrate-binding protein
LTNVVPGQSYTFTVRKDYSWGPGGAGTNAAGIPAKVVLQVVTNETTRANLLLSGQVNFARVGGGDQQRLIAQGMRKVPVPNSGAWLWFSQLGDRPTADKKVRQALASALNLDQLIKINTGGSGSAATGLINREPRPCSGDTVTGRLPRYDTKAAQTLLDQAGWIRGADGIRRKAGKTLSMDLHYAPPYGSAFDKPTAELIAQQWKTIGVKSKLTADTAASFNEVVFKTSNYDVYMLGFGADLPTQIERYVSGPTPPKGINLAGIENKDYNAFAAKAGALTPPAACRYWNQAEAALWRDVNPVPISTRPWFYFLNKAQAQVAGIHVPVPTSLRVLD